MKKIFTLALMSIMVLATNATELFSGSQFVTWGQGLQLEAAKFADAKPGDKLVITYTDASDGIELKVMDDFNRLPGSLQWCPVNGDGTVEQYLTYAAVAKLQAAGLEMIGNHFTVTKVELLEGKNDVTENTVWTGYFWMNEWSTIEIVKTSFDGVNWANYKAIRFYSQAGRTDYVINVMTQFDNPDAFIGNQNNMTMTNDYAELSLDGIDMSAKLAFSDKLMVQCNKEGGSPFNFTAIELIPSTPTAINNIVGENSAREGKFLENGNIILIKNGKKYNVAGQINQ